jgi:hypothetical protein
VILGRARCQDGSLSVGSSAAIEAGHGPTTRIELVERSILNLFNS